MKKILLSAYIILVLLVCVCSNQAKVNGNNLKQNKALEIITEHFGDFYFAALIQKHQFKHFTGSQTYNNLINKLEAIKKIGLIDYNVTDDYNLLSKNRVVDVSLTEQGLETHHISHEENINLIGFIVGNREIIEIININIDNNTVYFSYAFKPNELGIAIGFEESKYRGKAKIVYDPFLKNHVFKGMMWSPWEREEWQPTNWYYEMDSKRVFTDRRGFEK